MAQVEKLHQLVHRHEFLIISRIPTQQGQEIDDGFGQVACLPIAGRHLTGLGVVPFEGKYREAQTVAVSLAQFAIAFRLQQQGQVGKGGHRVFPAESTVEQHVQWGRRQPLLAADDVRNFHQVVIHDVGQMVGGQLVG